VRYALPRPDAFIVSRQIVTEEPIAMYLRRSQPALACLALLVACTSLSVSAAWYNPVDWFKKNKTPDTLIVTSNYLHSRLLAELIQRRTKQPVLILPTGEESNSIYILNADAKQPVMELKSSEYQEFVELLHPRTVVFLGNETYAPQQYVDQVKEGLVVSVFRHDDWNKIAESVGQLLKLRGLPDQYQELLSKYDHRGRVIQGKSTTETIKEWKANTAGNTGTPPAEVPAAR
jgi:hypothetical protein